MEEKVETIKIKDSRRRGKNVDIEWSPKSVKCKIKCKSLNIVFWFNAQNMLNQDSTFLIVKCSIIAKIAWLW